MNYEKAENDSFPQRFVPHTSNVQDITRGNKNQTIKGYFLRTVKHWVKDICSQRHFLAGVDVDVGV
jgi:hypothetical protein